MEKIQNDVLYMLCRSLKNEEPDKERLRSIDIDKLYSVCHFHSIASMVCSALENAGISDKRFTDARLKAFRKNILLDNERTKICNEMEKNKIWYMPLKGSVTRKLYPEHIVRQMADVDILYDRSEQNQLSVLMKNSGYTVESFAKYHHDVYMKEPVYNFEMHISLFDENDGILLEKYYSNIKEKMIKDDGKEYAYHLTREDLYIYITAHEYKHYIGAGTGLRSLVDCYIYLKENRDMDFEYIKRELDILKISDFEENTRKLAEKIFAEEDYENLSENESQFLDYYFSSGTYGTVKNKVINSIDNMAKENKNVSKSSYIWSRLFPSMDFYRINYPFFYRHKLLLPFGWMFRLFRCVFCKNKTLNAELKTIKEIKM